MVEIASNQHLFCCGRTRSGKSMLIKTFLPRLYRVVLHDRKFEHVGLIRTHQFLLCNDPIQLQAALNQGVRRILYQPIDPALEDFDAICKIIFDTKNITLIVDEASAVYENQRSPLWAKELLRLGAQRGIGVWNLSQRPRGCDNTCISEAMFIISFKLNLATDRMKITETIGREYDGVLSRLPMYHFLLWDGITGEVHLCKPIKVA